MPHHHVLSLAKRPEYQARRTRWQESRHKPSADIEHEDWGIEPHDPRGESRATRKNHGDYLTTKQTALALGVAPSSVRNLMLRGRLQGHQLRPKKPGSAKNPYWFFKRQDVDNLLADPAYRRNSKRGKQAHWLPNRQDE